MRFSIVIPVAPLRKAPVLKSIETMEYDKSDFEVIVERGTNPSIGRNKGIKKAKGEIIAFVDDDAEVTKEWLGIADVFFKGHPDISIVGGPQLTPLDAGVFQRGQGNVFSSYFGSYKMSSRYKRGKMNLDAEESNLTSVNMFVRKNVFDVLKPFNGALYPNEETEFLFRSKKSGLGIAFNPDLVVYHKRRESLWAFSKQCFGYGTGRARQDLLTGSVPGLKVVIPMLFMLYVLMLPVFYRVNVYISSLFFIYMLISLSNAIIISVRSKDIMQLFLFPLLCMLNHMLYPAGYLYEYIKRHLSSRGIKRGVNGRER